MKHVIHTSTSSETRYSHIHLFWNTLFIHPPLLKHVIHTSTSSETRYSHTHLFWNTLFTYQPLLKHVIHIPTRLFWKQTHAFSQYPWKLFIQISKQKRHALIITVLSNMELYQLPLSKHLPSSEISPVDSQE